MVKRVAQRFSELHDIAQEQLGDGFRVAFAKGVASDFPEKRNMAYCVKFPDKTMCIVVAPKMETARLDQIEGVLRHEFGHAALFFCEQMNHGERDADEAARVLFGKRIRYDDDLIQSTTTGVCPRPAHLGY
jgi:hypothetical protein